MAVAGLVRRGSCAQPARLHDRGNGAAPDMAREPGLPAEGEQLSHAGIRVRWIAQMAH
jgi:hypothetical protein